MDWLFIALRIVHIFTGVAWVGGAALFFFYIEPTINTLGPDAERFVDELVNQRKVPIYFLSASTLNILFGLLLYWRDSGGLQLSWIESPTPELHRSAELRGVAAISSHQVWAVGTRNYLHPLLMHWTGSEWRVAFKPLVNGILNDVARVPHMHELWAVGSSSPNSLIMRYC